VLTFAADGYVRAELLFFKLLLYLKMYIDKRIQIRKPQM